jgi:hypothetical protein
VVVAGIGGAVMGNNLVALLLVLVVVLLVALAVAIYYGVRLWRLWSLVHDPEMPAAARYAFYGALIYAICPVDLLPDPIYLDDVGVLVTAITFITKTAKRLGLLQRRRNTPVAGPPAGRAIEDGWSHPRR